MDADCQMLGLSLIMALTPDQVMWVPATRRRLDGVFLRHQVVETAATLSVNDLVICTWTMPPQNPVRPATMGAYVVPVEVGELWLEPGDVVRMTFQPEAWLTSIPQCVYSQGPAENKP